MAQKAICTAWGSARRRAYVIPEGPGAPFLALLRAYTKSSNEKSAVMSSGGNAGVVKQASAGATKGGEGARGLPEGAGIGEPDESSVYSSSEPGVEELIEEELSVGTSEKLH